MAPEGINLARNSLDGVSGDLLELGHDSLDEVAADVDTVEVLLELGVGKLHTSRLLNGKKMNLASRRKPLRMAL